MQTRRSSLLLLLVAVLTTVAACATGGKVREAQEHPGRDIGASIRLAEEHAAVGNYTAALMLYAELYDTCRDRRVVDLYIAAGKQVREMADRALQKKDFPNAGRLYTALLESKVTSAAQLGLLSFDDGYLKRQIRICTQALMETGLVKYRDEQLDDAIAAWEKVLVFDPENRTVLRAIDTANRQRSSLKKMP